MLIEFNNTGLYKGFGNGKTLIKLQKAVENERILGESG